MGHGGAADAAADDADCRWVICWALGIQLGLGLGLRMRETEKEEEEDGEKG